MPFVHRYRERDVGAVGHERPTRFELVTEFAGLHLNGKVTVAGHKSSRHTGLGFVRVVRIRIGSAHYFFAGT